MMAFKPVIDLYSLYWQSLPSTSKYKIICNFQLIFYCKSQYWSEKFIYGGTSAWQEKVRSEQVYLYSSQLYRILPWYQGIQTNCRITSFSHQLSTGCWTGFYSNTDSCKTKTLSGKGGSWTWALRLPLRKWQQGIQIDRSHLRAGLIARNPLKFSISFKTGKTASSTVLE